MIKTIVFRNINFWEKGTKKNWEMNLEKLRDGEGKILKMSWENLGNFRESFPCKKKILALDFD